MVVGVVGVFEHGRLPRDRVTERADPGGGESGMGIHVGSDNGPARGRWAVAFLQPPQVCPP